MNTKIKSLLAVLCGFIIMCNCGVGIVANAQEKIETLIVGSYQELPGDNVEHGIYDIQGFRGGKAATLADCSIGISVSANGVKGSITTGSTVTASKIGVENIRVEKYVNGKWTLVGTHTGGYTTNNIDYAMNVSTSSAEKGVQYRISCTHFAILNGVRHELNNVTNGLSY